MIPKKAISNCDILIPIIDRISLGENAEIGEFKIPFPLDFLFPFRFVFCKIRVGIELDMKILASICGFIVQGFNGLACAWMEPPSAPSLPKIPEACCWKKLQLFLLR